MGHWAPDAGANPRRPAADGESPSIIRSAAVPDHEAGRPAISSQTGGGALTRPAAVLWLRIAQDRTGVLHQVCRLTRQTMEHTLCFVNEMGYGPCP